MDGGKKAYFFFDECVLHLGAQLYSNSKAELITTYDQCNLFGDVYADDKLIKSNEDWVSLDCGFVCHNHKAYINLDNTPLRLKAGEAVASYKRIIHSESAPEGEVRQDTFTLIRPHTSNASDSYIYAVMPDADMEQAKKFIENNPVTVIENTDAVQAVVYKNVLYAVFYKPHTIKHSGKAVSADKPCILIEAL